MLQSVRTIGAAAATAACAVLVVVSPVSANPCEKANGNGVREHCEDEEFRNKFLEPVSPASTPELGSLLLFGSGLVGAGGYALTRIRAARRPD
jgi:hypothetical protein